MDDCLFCKIIQNEIKAYKIYEDDNMLIFKDIHPKAKVHFLTIPKKHIISLIDAQSADNILLGNMLIKSAEIAAKSGLSGFKTQINNGVSGGQEVFHLHIHTLGDN